MLKKKFSIKSSSEIEIMREGGKRLSSILWQVAKAVRSGMQTRELDIFARNLIEQGGDEPAFLNYKPEFAPRPFPATLCVSVNDEVVHGIPGERVLSEGDIVGLDLGLKHQGFFVDMAVTVPVGNISEADKKLIEMTKQALLVGIAEVKDGVRTGDIGAAIARVVIPTGLSIVEELGGHGVGEQVHELPFIANFGRKGTGTKLVSGQTIALEPMLNAGRPEVIFDKQDGFTIRTRDHAHSAHFEVTLVVTPTGADILTPIFW